MSLTKLYNFLSKVDPSTLQVPHSKTPVLLSDSKGRYLQDEIGRFGGIENDILFWCKSGATCRDQYDYLVRKLETKLQSHPAIVLYIWVGNCDLTEKTGPVISLKTLDSSTVRQITDCYRDIYNFVSRFPTVELVFLEIPPYSIFHYNKRNQPTPLTRTQIRQFKRDDFTLNRQIDQVNSFIRDTNRMLHKSSPRFSIDLQNCRKDLYLEDARYTFRFYALYLDGIHPCPTLAIYWLVRLCQRMVTDCA